MTTEELRESLLMAPKNGYTRLNDSQKAEMEAYCKRYMDFMTACKTEREATSWAVQEAEKLGFKPYTIGMAVNPGDKIYYNNRGKSIALAVVGTEPLSAGANICAAHVDSPRLDLKPNPLYEDSEIAYFKTHYYGGIKKYQWPTIPLALHGVVYRKDGSVVTVTIGEEASEPILMISDLLPHLSADQMQKTLAKGIEGEQLNVILGTTPLEGEGSDLVKLAIMKLLNEKYGRPRPGGRSGPEPYQRLRPRRPGLRLRRAGSPVCHPKSPEDRCLHSGGQGGDRLRGHLRYAERVL